MGSQEREDKHVIKIGRRVPTDSTPHKGQPTAKIDGREGTTISEGTAGEARWATMAGKDQREGRSKLTSRRRNSRQRRASRHVREAYHMGKCRSARHCSSFMTKIHWENPPDI